MKSDLIMRLANAKEQPNNFGLSRYLHLKTALLERPDVIDTGFEPFIFESVHKFVVAAGKVDPSTVEAFWKKKEKKAAEVVRCLCEELEMAVEDLFGSHQFIPTLKKNNFDPFKRLRNSRILRPETLYVGLVDPEIRRLRSCGGRPGSAYEESVGKLQVLATKLTDLRMSLRNSKEDMDQAGKEFNEIHLRYIDEAIKRIKNALGKFYEFT